MNARLDDIVYAIRDNASDTALADMVGVLSTGERCYVALAAGRMDLLPAAYDNPIEAWYRLDADWQLAVCRMNGWPEAWVAPSRLEIGVDLHRLRLAMDAAGIPASTRHGAEAIAERLQYLIEERDGLRMQVEGALGGTWPRHSASRR